jgi:hypothetical protein
MDGLYVPKAPCTRHAHVLGVTAHNRAAFSLGQLVAAGLLPPIPVITH